MMMIVVRPATGEGRFSALMGGRVLVKSSKQPFLAAARVLGSEGADPGTKIVMRHDGSDVGCLISTVGYAAAMTVDDRGPTFKRWTLPLVFWKD